MSTSQSKKFPVFWVSLLVFVILLLAFWGCIIWYVYSCMVKYEAAQPDRLLAEVAQQLQDGTLEASSEPSSRFEEAAGGQPDLSGLANGQEITWKKSLAGYDPAAPVYELYAGDTAVAEVTLREKSSQVLMLILTLQEWEVDSVTLVADPAEPWVITVPQTYTVYLNGVAADERELTGATYEMDQFQYASAYVTVPVLVEYQVEGLTAQPTIEVRDSQDRVVDAVEIDGHQVRCDSFLPSDMPEELETFVLQNAKDYSNFFSADLRGSSASIDPIRQLFPENSDYLELAENYRQHDMWMYSAHSAPVFSQEKVSNYIVYSDDLFSCDVYFDKEMTLTKTGEERHDVTNTRFYYVNLDGEWLIADMQQIIDEDDAV